MHWGNERRRQWTTAMLLGASVLFWLHTSEMTLAQHNITNQEIAYVR